MATAKRDLELGEDIEHQYRSWRIEKIAWVIFTLILLATLLGLTGHGWFSERLTEAGDSGIVVDYQRFERYHAQTMLGVVLPPDVSAARLRVGAEFLRKVEVLRIDPEPHSAELDGAYTTFTFAVDAPGEIRFHYMPRDFGSMHIEIGLEGLPLQILPQFVYP